MTTYSADDLNQDWEFKIVRSEVGAFRKPKNLRRLVEEEARAGWELLEKFDSNRVRFKRPTSARAHDSDLLPQVDPYRTRFDTFNWGAIMGFSLVLGMIILVALLVIIMA